MKKILWVVICLLVFPCALSAFEGIDKYYIDATVMENGDLHVLEYFNLTGSYNGFERIINYRNSSAPVFDASPSSFGGSDIYNGSDIEINRIMLVDKLNEFSFNNINGTNCEKTSYATSGDFGVYTITNDTNGYAYRIYNPSSYNKAFYIDYTIKNIAIVHNDIAEIGWNLFTSLNEDVRNLKVVIHVPNNKTDLRAWGHGPIIGDVDLANNETIVLTLSELYANDAVDTRFVFSHDVVPYSTKLTGVNALDNILAYESEKADEANRERERLTKQYNMISYSSNIVKGILILGAIFLVYHTYQKHDKEYKADFIGKYFRDFPANYGPETVGYLFNRNVGNNDMSAAILNLIYKKKIKFEPKEKNDYILTLEPTEMELSDADNKLIKFLFDDTTSVSLKEIKKKADKDNSFISKYTAWYNSALAIAKNEKFYESKAGIKAIGILYALLGLFVSFISFSQPIINYKIVCYASSVIGMIGFFIMFIYFIVFTKKTKKGVNDYAKWKGLKNYLNDFSRFNEKDLPEIYLWEKYLVYAVSLGCADRLSKTMKIKIKEMQNVNPNMANTLDFGYYNSMMIFNRELNHSINTSISRAYSAKSAAESRSSSGSGFGGGFSSGGGSFGGGGGGGRF